MNRNRTVTLIDKILGIAVVVLDACACGRERPTFPNAALVP